MRPAYAVAATVLVAVTGLHGCGQGQEEVSVDRATGRECFELHLDSLPPGSQYEGVVSDSEGILQVRVMNGVDLVTVECALSASGEVSLRDEGAAEQ